MPSLSVQGPACNSQIAGMAPGDLRSVQKSPRICGGKFCADLVQDRSTGVARTGRCAGR